MAARVFVQRRTVLGLRPLAFVVVAFVGTLVALVVPFVAAGLLAFVGLALRLPPPVVLLAALVGFAAPASVMVRVLARMLDRSTELRLGWGRIAVGTEGIRCDGWVRPRLTRWRDVRETITECDAVIVLTRAGARIVLAADDVVALRDSIRDARARHASSLRADIPDALSSERDTPRWIARAGTLLARETYRDGGISPGALARVLEDPDAPAAARVGAAPGLLPCGPGQRERIARVRDESVDVDFALVLDDLLDERVVPARWARLAERTHTPGS